MYRTRSLCVVLALLGSSTFVLTQTQTPSVPAIPSGQPAQRPMFRSAVELIEVDARVLDEKGNAVRDLKQEDFELLEDNKPQKIDTFRNVFIPAVVENTPAFARSRVDPDVVSTVESKQAEGRLYVMLLDDRLVSAQRTQHTIRIARQFIETNLSPRDLTAVVTTSGRTDLSQNFTANRELLLKTVSGFVGRKSDMNPEWEPRPPDWGPGAVVGALPTPATDDNLKTERYFESRASLQAIASLTDWLGTVRGRSKSLIYISEGLDFNYEDINDTRSELLLAEQRDAIAAATRANVTIYPIDPRMLGTDDTITVGNNGLLLTPGSDVPQTRPVSGTRTTQMRQDMERGQMMLRQVADDTGGFAVVNTNDMTKWLTRIVSESSSYYLLGYTPTNTRREGKFRNIRVRVKRPGLRVVARKGYIEAFSNRKPPAPLSALANTTSPEVRELLNGVWPVADLPLTATAVAFRGQNNSASIAVILESPAENLALQEVNGKMLGDLEVSTVAVDQQNTIVGGQTSHITFGLSPATHERFKAKGFRTMAQIADIKPGRYQLRLAVAPAASSLRGSLWYDLEVPDFSKGDLTVSGILLSSLVEGHTPTGNPGKLFVDTLTVPPTAVREFKLDDELNVYAEVYDNDLTPPHQVDVTVTIRAADTNRIVYTTNDWASTEELAIGKGAYPSKTWIPLQELGGPGNYVLSVQAQRALDGTTPISRSVPFKVVK
jgi:VWFA-related protein